MIQVLVYAPFSMTLMDKFRAVSPELEIEQEEQPERRWPDDRITEAEIVFAISAIPTPDHAPKLRWLQTHWAGVEHLREESIWKSDITIT